MAMKFHSVAQNEKDLFCKKRMKLKCRYLVGSRGSVKIHTLFDKTGDANKEHWFRRYQGN